MISLFTEQGYHSIVSFQEDFMVISTSKITSKRQITLPIKVMSRLKLHPGDSIIFEENNGHVEVKSIPTHFTIHDFVKKYHGATNKKLSDTQIRQGRKQAWQDRSK